jgi:hypothetical protein
MKIAILTQPLGHNYGGLIQNWALQQQLIKLGHEPITIHCRKISRSRRRKLKDLVWCSAVLLFTGFKRNGFKSDPTLTDPRYSQLRRFIVDHMNVTEPLIPPLTFKSIEQLNCDAIIVGSDQVWRPSYSPNLLNYFCDFLPENAKQVRIAYAASFGSSEKEFSERLKFACAELLQQFEAVSVREESAVTLCQRLFGVLPEHVVDPVLLLQEQDFLSLFDEEAVVSEKHIATYLLDVNLEKVNVANVVADFLKLDLRYLTPYAGQGRLAKLKALSAEYECPSQCLSKIKYSAFVVTDSFHGLCFSLIFRRPFVVMGNVNRGLDRFNSILSLVGLSERLLSSDASEQEIQQLLLVPIDWEDVHERLDRFRARSLRFLRDALNQQ